MNKSLGPSLATRLFHSGGYRSFRYQGAEAKKKTWTPKKASGEHRNFRKAAAYSNYQKTAPNVDIDQNKVSILSDSSELDKVKGMFVFPALVGRTLTQLSAFEPHQYNELFKERASLARKETTEMAEFLNQGAAETSSKNVRVITGPSGIGKSTLIMQTLGLAKLKGYILVHIPRAMDLVDGSGDAVPPRAAGESVWNQTMYAKEWLKTLFKVNRDLLSPACKKILASKASSSEKLEHFFEHLQGQDTPVLFSLDGLNAWTYKPFVENRDTENEKLYFGKLQVPRIFLDFVEGKRSFKRGAVLAALTARYPVNHTIPLGLRGETYHAYAPTREFDVEFAKILSRSATSEVSYMTLQETKEYFDYLRASGLVPELSQEQLYSRYLVAGSGNPRALLKGTANYIF